MFIGRENEIKQLIKFARRKVAGLIVCRGRRRIGKSTLISHFAEQITAAQYIQFFGLAPRENISSVDQLKHFGEQLALAFHMPALNFSNWNEAFEMLAALTAKGKFIILFDEISWMACDDRDFAGKLKGVWDTKFKKNDQLILILCGSVTNWIQENILEDKGFVGRVSLTLTLDELPLYDANKFWPNRAIISNVEKFKILCVTGGIPRYLEEIQTQETAEQNIKRLCFQKEGLLFREFNDIFVDIFEKKSEDYKKILLTLIDGSCEAKDICKKLGVESTGAFSKKLKALRLSGFVSQDYMWNHKGKKKLSKYRLSDNYMRFYLKYIEPKKNLIEKDLYQEIHLENLPGWYTMLGLQFENLVLNNLVTIVKKLDIPASSIISASPYFQHKTQRQQACQIDLLIQTKHCYYVCEIKFQQKINSDVILEMKEKINKLKFLKNISVRPVLIYQGQLSKNITDDNFFHYILSFEELFTVKY